MITVSRRKVRTVWVYPIVEDLVVFMTAMSTCSLTCCAGDLALNVRALPGLSDRNRRSLIVGQLFPGGRAETTER